MVFVTSGANSDWSFEAFSWQRDRTWPICWSNSAPLYEVSAPRWPPRRRTVGIVAVEGNRRKMSAAVDPSISGRIKSRIIRSGQPERAFRMASSPDSTTTTLSPASLRVMGNVSRTSIRAAANKTVRFMSQWLTAPVAAGNDRQANFRLQLEEAHGFFKERCRFNRLCGLWRREPCVCRASEG